MRHIIIPLTFSFVNSFFEIFMHFSSKFFRTMIRAAKFAQKSQNKLLSLDTRFLFLYNKEENLHHKEIIMKRYAFEKQQLPVSQALLDKIIDACLTCPTVTRSQVSAESGASLSSVGKVLQAMEQCRFTCKRLRQSSPNSKPSFHHTLNEAIAILVLDLSSSVYSMSIVTGNSECRFCEAYTFDQEISLMDNILAFFSRLGIKAVKQSFGISAVCVVTADPSPSDDLRYYPYLPSDNDLQDIDALIARFFKRQPILRVTASEAITAALKYRILSEGDQSAAYIYVGNTVRASFHPSANEKPYVCQISDLLISDSTTLGEEHAQLMSEKQLCAILSRAVNFMNCAFSPERYLIEYDTVKFSSAALSSIKRTFALLNRPLPEIVTVSHTPGLAARGAAVLSMAKFIKDHITSTNTP